MVPCLLTGQKQVIQTKDMKAETGYQYREGNKEVNKHLQNCDSMDTFELGVKGLAANTYVEKTWTDDFVLVVEGRKLYVAKALLAHVSPVIDRMFQSEFKEKHQDEMELPEKKFDDVLKFLKCVGPGEQTDIDDNNVYQILPLADEYQVSYLKSKCEDFLIVKLKNDLTAEEIYELLHIALTYKMESLCKGCAAKASEKSVTDLDTAMEKMSIPSDTVDDILDKMVRRLEHVDGEIKSLRAVYNYLLLLQSEEDQEKILSLKNWQQTFLKFTLNVSGGQNRTKVLDQKAEITVRFDRIYKCLDLDILFDLNDINGVEILVFGRFTIKNNRKENKDFVKDFQMSFKNAKTKQNKTTIFCDQLFKQDKGYISHDKVSVELNMMAAEKQST